MTNTENLAPQRCCQSCTLPVDDLSLRGTEADGSLSKQFCKFCFMQGQFTHPDMTMSEMSARIKKMMERQGLPSHAPFAMASADRQCTSGSGFPVPVRIDCI
ncbi:MAG: hypothetical protein EOO05_02285 [Chitinophagaceae bacterium]|nr:MAG: hypothetical protein EOO05_02285 [Chitinophagaceae bacterium]